MLKLIVAGAWLPKLIWYRPTPAPGVSWAYQANQAETRTINFIEGQEQLIPSSLRSAAKPLRSVGVRLPD